MEREGLVMWVNAGEKSLGGRKRWGGWPLQKEHFWYRNHLR